ncbi:4-alpha-glucanotransferase [bacterium]|nr:4-alpha-glucanotransferase [bacterium]
MPPPATIDAIARVFETSGNPDRALAPPALVVREGEPIACPLADAHPGERIVWRLWEESGALRCGDAAAESHGNSGVRLIVAAQPASGYHRLVIHRDGAAPPPGYFTRLIVVPRRAFEPSAIAKDSRVWGFSTQLYALRSERNWGIGDFSDLARLCEIAGDLGADVVGVSPLHALFPHKPSHASPYSPSSRNFLNTLFIDVESAPGFADSGAARALISSPRFQRRLSTARRSKLVNYERVADLKRAALAAAWDGFRAAHLDTDSPLAAEFGAYCEDGGAPLRLFALHEALREAMHGEDSANWGWPAWPNAYLQPFGARINAFLLERRDEIFYHAWLQWVADRQLGEAARRCFERGLGLGLYLDIAVSVAEDGAEAWAHQDAFALGMSVGAPPDDFNRLGQNWGVPPWNPRRLQSARYEPFIRLLRRNMRHAGAIRLDHVMSLMRLFWIPRGAAANEGAYVEYPLADLVGIVALESVRNACLVIGEDLGTVPEEVRTALADAGVLSYRVFWFEREADGAFRAPGALEKNALIAASTHDLPTIAGYLRERDIDWRAKLNLFPQASGEAAARADRREEKRRLVRALHAQRLGEGVTERSAAGKRAPAAKLSRDIHAYLASGPSKVLAVQWEDVLGVVDQPNLPGTIDEHPNWRARLPIDIEDIPGDSRVARHVAAIRARREPSRG